MCNYENHRNGLPSDIQEAEMFCVLEMEVFGCKISASYSEQKKNCEESEWAGKIVISPVQIWAQQPLKEEEDIKPGALAAMLLLYKIPA